MKETVIIGNWIVKNGRVLGDDNCLLIEEMVKNRFEVVGKSDDGWTTTYKDKHNHEMWELTYPESHLQGGAVHLHLPN